MAVSCPQLFVSWLPGMTVALVCSRRCSGRKTSRITSFNQVVLTVVLITHLTPALILLGAPFQSFSGFFAIRPDGLHPLARHSFAILGREHFPVYVKSFLACGLRGSAC